MKEIEEIKKELQIIKERNQKVESDKAWETSWTRKLLVALFTYFAIGLYFTAIQVEQPWLNSIVPAIGFMLSTLTMPLFKKIWLEIFYNSSVEMIY